MESPEEAMGSNSSTSNGNGGECTHGTSTATVVKGKRTKRQRNQPLALEAAMAVTDSSSASSADASGSITEEEEDMANCLILLAQGRALDAVGPKPESPAEEGGGTDKFTSRRFTEAATTTGGKAGFYVYECKTCSKCFPSFQALGGHRASHKKPKLAITAGEEKKPASSVEEDMLKISMNSFPKAMVSGGSTKPRVHECSICGSEFSSGQALGGHMRRHRPVVIPEAAEAKKERAILSLDLNLPAPDDDDRPELQRPSSPAFSFASKPPLIFPASASALVDCHY